MYTNLETWTILNDNVRISISTDGAIDPFSLYLKTTNFISVARITNNNVTIENYGQRVQFANLHSHGRKEYILNYFLWCIEYIQLFSIVNSSKLTNFSF